MQQDRFTKIEQAWQAGGAPAALEQLAVLLQEQRDWHNLFDARMLQRKLELSLPLGRLSSLADVPDEFRKTVEETYVSAAREAGQGFLEDGDIPSAWMYLQAIREPEKVAAALEKLPDQIEDFEQLDRLLQIALFQGAHPLKGTRMMLHGHGLCSTITALDQVFPQLTPAQRSECARLLVRTIHPELKENVRQHVEQRVPLLEPELSLPELIAGRDWLFEGGNYHVDVSHLNSVVRLARSIEGAVEEISLAAELAQYGSRLDRQLQYDGDAPFSDFYAAHLHLFRIRLNHNREAGLNFFRAQLEQESDERDRALAAYVLVDLLAGCECWEEAADVALQQLASLGEDAAITLEDICRRGGRLAQLQQLRRDQDNLVRFTAALLSSTSTAPPPGR